MADQKNPWKEFFFFSQHGRGLSACLFFLLPGSPAEMSPSTLSPVSHGLGKTASNLFPPPIFYFFFFTTEA